MKTNAPRTSTSHPLHIAEIRVAQGLGKLGLTLCPGKKQSGALTGAWERDLGVDLEAVSAWDASAVLTLLEGRELDRLHVPTLGEEVRARHMTWLHLPIPDRGVPDAQFEEAWALVGESLRARLCSGFNVLTHCMGGLGRAGTIASRLLVELGWSAADAVLEVRRVRPGAIETAEQLRFVHETVPIDEHEPNVSVQAVRDRAVGALLGLAVGDALGTTLEFSPRDSRPRLTSIEGGGPFHLRRGQWTDDTAMALALADSLLADDEFDERDLMNRFVSWWKQGTYSATGSCFDIGMTVCAALRRFIDSDDPIAGLTDPMSAGNGSLMRLSPVAIRFWNAPESLRATAARQSETTHRAAEAIDACVLFAEMLSDAIAGQRKSEVLRDRIGDWTETISSIANGSWRGRPRSTIQSSGYVVHSLEAAIWCVGRTGSFSEAVLMAANLGNDADTTAAITGQLAGAIYGRVGIPREWLEALHQRSMIETVAAHLFARSCIG